MTDARENLELEAAALVELQNRKRDNPLYYFTPNRKLRRFHSSRARIRMNSGGNRSGKTQHVFAEGCSYALGFRPWILREQGIPPPHPTWKRPEKLPEEAICVNGAGVRVPVPNTVLFVTGLQAKRGIGEAIHPKVVELLGPVIKKTYYGQANIPTEVVLHNGSRIIYASAEQKGLSFESTNHTAYFIDEPISKRVYTGIRRGSVDQFAPLVFSFTPLGRHAPWMFTELYRRADQKDIATFNISIFDNYFLSKEAIEDFANDPTISDVEKEARLYGRFIHLVDRIYPQFEESPHIIPPLQPDPDWYTGWVCDPHTVRPWAMAWFCVTPRGDIVWYREWPQKDFTTIRRDTRTVKDYAALIRGIEDTRPADIRLLDPNYGPRQDVVRGVAIPSTRDVLGGYGLHCVTKLSDDIEYGESRVRALLAYDKTREVDDLNRPKMYFCSNCQNLINSMFFYTARNRSAEDDMPDETLRDPTYKDFADLVRYAGVSNIMDYALSDSFMDSAFGEQHESTSFGPGTYGE
jgi:hypothetical protein